MSIVRANIYRTDQDGRRIKVGEVWASGSVQQGTTTVGRVPGIGHVYRKEPFQDEVWVGEVTKTGTVYHKEPFQDKVKVGEVTKTGTVYRQEPFQEKMKVGEVSGSEDFILKGGAALLLLFG